MAGSAGKRHNSRSLSSILGGAADDGGPDEPPRLTRITHATLYEKVYEELRNALMSGRFLPGETLTIRGVAEALGTSIMPVREALRRLAAERAVQFHADRSIRIPLLDEHSFGELLEMRYLLEGRAAAAAARRMTRSEWEEANFLNMAYIDAAGEATPTARLLANRHFHFAIYQAARAPLTLSLIEMLWLQSGPYLMAPMGWRAARNDANSYFVGGIVHHAELLDALDRADAAAAAAAVQADIRDAAQAYRAVLAAREAGQGSERS